MRLHDVLDYRAREYPEREFAVERERRLTYRDAAAATNRLAHAFIRSGLATGDRVAILSRNCVEYVLLYFAAAKAGVVPVPLNYRLAPPEWSYIINDAGARVLFAAAEYIDAVDRIRTQLSTIDRVVAIDGTGPTGWEPYQRWSSDCPATAPNRHVTPEHDAYQMYTSGTTGHPKGAVLTHRAVTANIAQIALACQGPPSERSLVVAPLFHAGAVPTTFSPVWWGGSLLILDQFTPVEVVRVLDEERIGFATLVPAMIQACLSAVPDAGKRRYEHLRLIYYGSSPVAEQTLRHAMAVFQCGFIQSYGMTEAVQSLTFLTPADHERALTANQALLLSAGRPAAGTEIRIVDADDNSAPNGTIGEVMARGPQLMRGYWNLPEASEKALRGGWLRTGDAGRMDDEGYLYIQDRVKDMIVSGGENIYPREVEEVLAGHPAVAEAAAIGVPDERWGETVKAIVVLREGAAANPEELVAFCRARLGGFKLPRSVDFVAVLPRTASGKVLKRELRERYWAGRERRVGGA